MTFRKLGITENILEALKAEGYTHPTPIQEKAIPILLSGKDLLGCAQTGTGKTAAFAIPILQFLQEERCQNNPKGKIRALIVTPTRELAIQISESFTAYGRFTGIKNTVVFGGVKQGPQTAALQRGVDVLVATPGRLLDLMGQGYISLRDIGWFVLDEADRMLDMGFIHDIKKIIAQLPVKRQSLFFSATMPPEIIELSQKILGNPEKVSVKPEQTTAEKVDQSVYFVSRERKTKLLTHLIGTDPEASFLVFSRTKHGADKIVKALKKEGIEAHAIHGNKSQGARQEALGNFKNGDTNVLVATDIAARGIDIEELGLVVNYDLPNIPETYVHRIGRTGRAGLGGTAISFCDAEEKEFLRDIQKLIRRTIPVIADHPFTGDRDEDAAGNSVAERKPEQQKRQASPASQSNPPRREKLPDTNHRLQRTERATRPEVGYRGSKVPEKSYGRKWSPVSSRPGNAAPRGSRDMQNSSGKGQRVISLKRS